MHDIQVYSPEFIAQNYLAEAQSLLLFGAGDTGKSTLAQELGRILADKGRSCFCIGADPGSPAFGVPGAVCLGSWRNDAWQLEELVPLCSLDAGRFRLPLVSAVGCLAGKTGAELFLIDAPGVIRSVVGAELLEGLVNAAAVATVLVLCHDMKKIPLAAELKSLSCKVAYMRASEKVQATRPRRRARLRTGLWDDYLENAIVKNLSVNEIPLTGTPPPIDVEDAWQGRQIGLLRQGRPLAMAEVLRASSNSFRIRVKPHEEQPDQIICRDAGRTGQGFLATLKPFDTAGRNCPPDLWPYRSTAEDTVTPPVIRIGDATAVLVNGRFGDPLLHLRIHNRKRSILFDLGEGGRLSGRLAHQVSHVLISHAHFDHIGGFLWLLRSRIAEIAVCNIFGPPGLAGHIEGFISGIHWDRIGNWGPQFIVRELHGDKLLAYNLQAGKETNPLASEPCPDGLLFEDSDCLVRAATLDHAGTPSVAYCLELAPKLNVKKEKLSARGLPAGPWLGKLKKHIRNHDRQTVMVLPDNTRASSGDLADELLKVTPARKLVYATDLTDNPRNREKLGILARKAHFFFCEAAFLAADKQYAELSGHLTTRGCGEIARNAGVETLVPFHFSRRYEKKPHTIYDEIRSFCGGTVLIPDSI